MQKHRTIPDLTHADKERFWSYIEVSQPSGCWEWTGPLTTSKYGKFNIQRDGKMIGLTAHRVTYHLLVGIPNTDLVTDHLCRNHQCCNPDHIRLVSESENILAGYCPPAINARKTHCKHGHEFTPENTVIDRGWRQCRICKNDRARQVRARQALAKEAA